MKSLLVITGFILSSFSVFGQNFSKAADCEYAIDLSDFFSGTIPAPEGFGDVKEIKGYDLKNQFYFTEEHNTYWFETVFIKDTEFEFIITPEYADDDYDFLIFYDSTGNFCDDLKTKNLKPVRSNMVRINPEEGSLTGLRKRARKKFESAGRGEGYSKPLYAKTNQKYYVVIDAPYGAEGGFGLEMFYNGKNSQGLSLEERQNSIVQKRSDKGRHTQKHQMFIEIRSAEDSLILEDVDLTLTGLSDEDDIVYQNNRFELSQVHHYRTYKMRIDKEKYKQINYSYHHSEDKDTSLVIYLEKLKEGSKLTFTDIKFAPNTARMLQSSLEDLNNIMTFLKTNPNISVEIMGHVNGVGGKKGKQKKLSKKRAKAIYDLLVSYGIPPERLAYKGYGGKMMVYPEPKNEQQAQQNRRVDVRVTKM